MYKLPDGQLDIYTLIHPLEDMLDPENRWVVRAKAMPWEELERVLSARLYSSRGAPAKPLRMMLGAMYIGDHLKCSDAETVRQIQENPYMQYFVGLQEFQRRPPFNVSLFSQFRGRLTPEARRAFRGLLRRYML